MYIFTATAICYCGTYTNTTTLFHFQGANTSISTSTSRGSSDYNCNQKSLLASSIRIISTTIKMKYPIY